MTTTPNLGLTKPTVGADTDTWGGELNGNADILDALFTTGPLLLLAKGGTGASTAAGARTNLGLGTASVKDTGTSGANVPLLNSNLTFSGNVSFQGGSAGGGTPVPLAAINNASYSSGQTVDFKIGPTDTIDMRVSGRASSSSQGYLVLQVYNSGTVSAVQVNYDKTLQFFGYGAGTLTTNSSGTVTASSDMRLKDVVAPFTRGLADLQKMDAPVMFSWLSELAEIDAAAERIEGRRAAIGPAERVSQDAQAAADAEPEDEAARDAAAKAKAAHDRALEDLARDEHLLSLGRPVYAGWIAQGVEPAIPEAVHTDPQGYKTLNDRAILAAAVNAILELSAQVEELRRGLYPLE